MESHYDEAFPCDRSEWSKIANLMPCDRSDWSKITALIEELGNVLNIKQALQVLLKISQQVHGTKEASVPHQLLEVFLLECTTEDEQFKIVHKILPVIASAAGSLKPNENLPIIKQQSEASFGTTSTSIAVDRDLLISIIANCVLCTIPLSRLVPVHPLVKFLSSSNGLLSNSHRVEKLRCIFKFFEVEVSGEVNQPKGSQVVYTYKVRSSSRSTEQSKGHCICPLLLPASLFLEPIGVDDVLEISGFGDGCLLAGHSTDLIYIGQPTEETIGQEELDSVYHDAIDQSDGTIESDYETAPESLTHNSFLSPYELVSGYSNSLSKAITNCAIYDAVRSRKLRRDSDDSRSSQYSSNSSNRSNPREQASFTESGHTVHNVAQYYYQDTDRLHVNLLRRRSSNELSSHHSTSLSEFGSEMDEYFGKKISAITEDDSQPHVDDFATTLASSVVLHGLHTASSLMPGIQQFEAKQPVGVAMRPIALRPTPDSITPELSSDGDHSRQVNSVEKFAQNMVEKSLAMIFGVCNSKSSPTGKFGGNTDNEFESVKGTNQNQDFSYKKIEKLASDLVEKLINDVVQKKKKRLHSSKITSPDVQKLVFDQKERASFAEAVDQLAGRVVKMAVLDAQDVVNDSLDSDSYGSINEEEYSIISPMSSLRESDSYEIIRMDSVSETSSSPVIIPKKSFSVEEYVEKILQESFTEVRNFKCGQNSANMPKECLNRCQENKGHVFDTSQFADMVISAALQKLNKLKRSNSSNRNIGNLVCLATNATVSCDGSKVKRNDSELFEKSHKLELPEPSTHLMHQKVHGGNSILAQEAQGRDVNTMFDRSAKASMSDYSENRLSGENSGHTPGTPPPTPDSQTKNNFDITKNNQHVLEEELRKRFAFEEPELEPSCKLTSLDSLASRLASAAVSDGIHKVCRREKKPSSASTFTEDLLKIGNIDITGKRPSCTEENIAIFREELRRASIEQERELERRGSQLSDFADELESARFKEDLQEIPHHIQEFAYELANNILASAFRQQFGDIADKNEEELNVDTATQESGAVSLDPAAQERNLLAMATNLANSIVASALQALRDGQAGGASLQTEAEPAEEPASDGALPSSLESAEENQENYWDPQMKPLMLWLTVTNSKLPGGSIAMNGPKLKKVCRKALEKGWNIDDLAIVVKDYTELLETDNSEELLDYILRISQT
ncbi:uncharacterized protein LOC117111512 isoform X2 [Anneissia japonica]|uniref:uncharacterized protein LOC117111512 isoform X2 n=1 Tax=Anneissia japonica TaxID=1529436 RepID=UPI0014259962|nr:uncharacterized protein LOC117111512 isoform X2 [Anneissia japonica]